MEDHLSTYLNSFTPDVEAIEFPELNSTTTSNVPDPAWGSVSQTISVAVWDVAIHGEPSMETVADSDVKLENVPEMVIVVPPPLPPSLGVTLIHLRGDIKA